MKIYLAGGFKSNWQRKVINDMANTSIQFFNPKEHNLDEPDKYTVWDTHFVKQSDIVFCYMEYTNPGGYGLAFEIGLANALNKTIILVDEKSELDKTFSRHFNIVKHSSSIVFNNLEDGVKYLKRFCV